MRIENNQNGTYCLTVCADELRILNASIYGTIKSAYKEPQLDLHQEHFLSVCMKVYEDLEQVINEIKKKTPGDNIIRCYSCASILKKKHPIPEDMEKCAGMCACK